MKEIRPSVKIAVFCGACQGEGLDKARHRFPNAKIYAIEPAKSNFDVMYAQFHKRPNMELINKAIWTENGTMCLNVYHAPFAHSLYRKPHLEDKGKCKEREQVETMDFAEFLSQFGKNEVLLRMDVEGAEYEVLLHCFEKGVMDRVMELHIEFHAGWRIPELVKYKDKLDAKLKEWGKTVVKVQ